MSDRDVERRCTPEEFVATLRRLADSIESGERFRIQVKNQRFTIPKEVELSIEHEVSDGETELELQLKWSDADADD